MNVIRTTAVELTAIPAIAYKHKLASGGAGIKILRLDSEESAISTIDKRTGELVPFGKVDEELFPYEAFEEALDLTIGLPYSARGKIKVAVTTDDEPAPEDEVVVEDEKTCMLDSAEYKAIIDRYMDEKGKMNYKLLNKDFIQFASKSTKVSKMVAERASTDDIALFVIKSRAALIANKKESLSDEETQALIDTLNEINPRSAFKELRAHIKRMLARKK